MVKTRVKSAGASDMGRVRRNNEDAWHIDAERGIYLVVDGVGGHNAGEKAAEIAVERVRARLERQTGTTEQRIKEAIAVANNEIFRAAQTNPDWKGMACVLTLAVLENGSAVVGHVGDSRLYQIGRGGIRKITHDHSPVGEREDAREISEAEAMRHPRRNEVYRDVGSEEHTPDDADFIEIQHVNFEADQALVICSDGLSDLVTGETIREIVERHAGSPDAAARDLIAAANDAGGKDNVTVVVVQGEQFRGPVAAATPVETKDRRKLVMILGALAVVELFGLGGAYLWKKKPQPAAPVQSLPRLWEVGPGQGTITEAMAQAQPRDKVVVRAGEYREQIVLKSGVTIVSDPPRGAILRAREGSTDPAVVADKVENARISGFLIQADAKMPLSAGIVLTDSSVEVDDNEISGAEVGVVIRGGGKPALRGNAVHECTVGVLVSGPAEPWISHNVITKNKKAGIVASEGGHPALKGNTFDRNKVDLGPATDQKALKEHNYFLTTPAAVPAGGGRKQ